MTADQRRIVILFGLVGAAIGVVWTMFFHSHPAYRQTDIGAGTQLMLLGTFLGACLGSVLAQVAILRPRFGSWLIGIGVLLLTALLGVSVGWMTANVPDRFHQEHVELTRRYSPLGGAIGAAVGLVVLSPRWLRRPLSVGRLP
jgi:hypothetical protein